MTNDAQSLLGLEKAPVAVGFLDQAPDGLEAWGGGPVPAGCTFWKAAQGGRAFYTTPADHYNCAVGAHTHGIPLPMARAAELEGTIGLMVSAGYLKMEEVPGIPTLSETPPVIAYGPVDQVSFAPSVVLVALRPDQAMLLYEAALRAGATGALMPSLGRPACAVLPLSLQGGASISLGCRGNRTFTGLGDNLMYVSVPGEKWPAVEAALVEISQADAQMCEVYTAKKESFS